MLRMSVAEEEYLMIGDDIKIVFLGGTGRHMRIMIDAPKEINIVRSSVLESKITDPEEKAKLPKFYAEPSRKKKQEYAAENAAPRGKQQEDYPKRKSNIVISHGNVDSK